MRPYTQILSRKKLLTGYHPPLKTFRRLPPTFLINPPVSIFFFLLPPFGEFRDFSPITQNSQKKGLQTRIPIGTRWEHTIP